MYETLKNIEVITAMVTPFNKEGAIDFNSLEKLTNHLINNGSDGLLVAGTTGETPTLTHDEEIEILKAVKNVAGNKAKIIMGAGSNSTQTALEMTKRVEAIGVDAILSVVPYYNKPAPRMLIEHFGDIAKSTSLPILIYNIPGRTAINMMPDTMAEIASKNKNIIGVKQSNPDLDQVTEIIGKTPEGFLVYSGDDSLTLPMVAMGGQGVISVVSHIAGKQMKELVVNTKSGNLKKAQELHQELYPLIKAVFMTSNPSPVKAALKEIGILDDNLRKPLLPLNDEERSKLLSVLKPFI